MGQIPVFPRNKSVPVYVDEEEDTSVIEVAESDFDHLTKDELIALAESKGVEVSKSWKKDKIIEALGG